MSVRSTDGSGPPGAAPSSSRQAQIRVSPRTVRYSTSSTWPAVHSNIIEQCVYYTAK